MNYKVLIPLNIKQDIAALPPELGIGVLHKLLRELPADPNKVLGEVVIPLARRAYNFTLPDKQGDTHWFVVHLDGVDPAAKPDLLVVGFRHMEFDPIADLGPPPP
jgi:hypothetical protein